MASPNIQVRCFSITKIILNIHAHTDPVNIEVVENTVYGVRPGTPDTRQRTTTGGIEMKPRVLRHVQYYVYMAFPGCTFRAHSAQI